MNTFACHVDLSQGKVVYANYGRVGDLTYLKAVTSDLNGTVALMRTGKISLAEKVQQNLSTPDRL